MLLYFRRHPGMYAYRLNPEPSCPFWLLLALRFCDKNNGAHSSLQTPSTQGPPTPRNGTPTNWRNTTESSTIRKREREGEHYSPPNRRFGPNGCAFPEEQGAGLADDQDRPLERANSLPVAPRQPQGMLGISSRKGAALWIKLAISLCSPYLSLLRIVDDSW